MPSRMGKDFELGEAPTSIHPYEVLGLSTDASQDEVKTAYRKAALKHHPDKVPPSDAASAHIKFQEIAFAYAVLSDERRRKRYDSTGRTDEAVDLDDDDFDWSDFFRHQFDEVVSLEKIAEFEKEYKGSEEEKGHVLEAYEKFEGNMKKLYENVMLSDMTEDEDRFRMIIDDAIATGQVDGYDKYTRESATARSKRITAARKKKDSEAKEAEKAAAELEAEAESSSTKKKSKARSTKKDAGGLGDLSALIQQRQRGRAENFFDNLEAKYGGGGGKKRGAEPPEELFEANRKKTKLNGGEKSGSGKAKAKKKQG